ncbi:MAG: hypothetical protein ACRYG5_00465 [Janthinobacterium lividum]
MAVEEWVRDIGPARFQRFASIVHGLFGDASQSAAPSATPQFFPTWHWLFTHETPVGARLALDGHPQARPDGVPADFTQRLWAGSEISLGEPPDPASSLTFRRSTEPARLKSGRSGELAFVPQTLEVLQGERIVVTERRTGVYRRPGARAQERAREAQAPWRAQAGVISREIRPDEITLFQYSALLGVSHRIHYDLAYTRQVEGYRALVIHGPLIAQLLVQHALASGATPDATAPLRAVKVQAIAPALLDEPLLLKAAAAPSGEGVMAWAEDGNRSIKMRVDLSTA